MATSVLDLPGVGVEQMVDSGEWQVKLGDDSYRVRPWTWGERSRLVAACTGPRGVDREKFVEGLVQLLVSPLPPPRLVPVLAAAALRLFGVRPEVQPATLLQAEAQLARSWKWGPAELEHQPAHRMDEHLNRLSPPIEAKTGWNTIVVVDE